MKYPPYFEIINFSKELKEYRKLCRGKSKKFTYYHDWKDHIQNLFKELDTLDKKEKFKHYLINNSRVNKNMNSLFATIMIFAATTFINQMGVILDIISLVIFILIILLQIMYEHDKNNKEYWFYKDLIEIIKEMQNGEADN